MKRKIQIGLIGCGAIGSSLARIIVRRFSDVSQLAYLCEHHPEKASAIRKKIRHVKFVSFDKLIEKSDFVIESASAEVARCAAWRALSLGKSILVLSVGGLLSEFERLSKLEGKGRLWVPSGAIAGLDGLRAARQSGLQEVKLVTRKPPDGLREAPYFRHKKFPILKNKSEVCVFRGNALAAVKAFPQNVNVAAAVSLAGMGPRKTKVEVWTSKAYQNNQHEIFVRSKCGQMYFKTVNVPSRDNPKTSSLAIYSAAAALQAAFDSIRIGS